MDNLLVQQQVAMRVVERALDNFKKVGRANYTCGGVRNRILNLNSAYAHCEQLHAQLISVAALEGREAEEYFLENRFEKMEDVYYTSSDYMANILAELEPPPSSPGLSVSQAQPATSGKISSNLPLLSLPKFSGELSEWESFRDQFRAIVIDNNDLSNVSRMHYLSSCLKDEARNVLRSLPITNSNFPVAWGLLVKRYDNKRRLVHEHIHALHNLPTVKTNPRRNLRLYTIKQL
ncbi:PREDICTED: uncharacterized protein LOC105450410 [Wasmannia auropunctata]|uniref:uncharacterized protein LOC105450410 n=1 Tax=Wasmannia auropunctata TaxID=64793 RepID=UPI0005EECF8A|nr:PREDICTED: uncharacterized protein LOC105450410 [Wasmannia auropunctata]